MKCLIVGRMDHAKELQPHMGDDWKVKTPDDTFIGLGFDLILISTGVWKCYQPRSKYLEWFNILRTRLKPGGLIVELY